MSDRVVLGVEEKDDEGRGEEARSRRQRVLDEAERLNSERCALPVSAEEEAMMEESVGEYLERKGVVGTAAEGMIREEYVEEARRRLSRIGSGSGVVLDELGRQLRHPSPVYVPTEKERREHEASGHYPFRSWCEYCVLGEVLASLTAEETRMGPRVASGSSISLAAS